MEGWPSQDKVQDEVRLNSQNTPQILSPVEERDFWLDWKLDHAHVAQLQLGRSIQRGQGNTGYGNSDIGKLIAPMKMYAQGLCKPHYGNSHMKTVVCK